MELYTASACRQSAEEIVALVTACAEARHQPLPRRLRLPRLPWRELRTFSHGSVQGLLTGGGGRSFSGSPLLPPHPEAGFPRQLATGQCQPSRSERRAVSAFEAGYASTRQVWVSISGA